MEKPKAKTSLPLLSETEGFHRGVCWGVTLTSSLGMFFCGYVFSVLNTILKYISESVFQWDSDEAVLYEGLLNSLICVGSAIGTLAGGFLAKNYGRKNVMIAADIMGIVCTALTLIESVPLLLIGRTLLGFAAGANCSVVPVYINEMNPLQIRGPTGSAIQTVNSAGCLLSLLMGFGTPQDGSQNWWWRFMLGLPILVCVARLALLSTIYNIESPKYLISKRRDEEAEKSLQRIYVGKQIQEQMILIKAEIEQQSASKQFKVSDLITPRWRYRFLIGLFGAAASQFTLSMASVSIPRYYL